MTQNLTEGEIINRGDKAQQLLANEMFLDLYDEVQRDLSFSILALSPSDMKERIELLRLYDGMRAFVQYVGHYHNEKLRVIEEIERKNREDEVSDLFGR